MASSRVRYFALFTCAIFTIKKLAFRSSNLPYDIEQSQSKAEKPLSILRFGPTAEQMELGFEHRELRWFSPCLSCHATSKLAPVQSTNVARALKLWIKNRAGCLARNVIWIFTWNASTPATAEPCVILVTSSTTSKKELIEINKEMFIVMPSLNSTSLSLKRALKFCIKY